MIFHLSGAVSDIQHSAEISRQLGNDKAKAKAFNEAMDHYRLLLEAYEGKPAVKAVA